MRELYSTQLAIVTGVIIVALTVFFAFIQSPELLEFPETAAAKAARRISHSIEGQEHCDDCHGHRGIKPYPLRHFGWKNESCTKCHVR